MNGLGSSLIRVIIVNRNESQHILVSHPVIAMSKSKASSLRGFHHVRVLTAMVLFVAATLKALQLATEPVPGTSIFGARWFLMAVVEFEFLFGACLAANVWPRPAWVASLVCFAAFTCVSLFKAITGNSSCGCFGSIEVNPWYTLGLDISVLLSLLRYRPPEPSFLVRGVYAGTSRGQAASVKRVSVVLVTWLLLGTPMAFLMGSYSDTILTAQGRILGEGRIIVLRPELWVGQMFPLLSHLEIDETLSGGVWLALLYMNGCSECDAAVASYEALSRDFCGHPGCPRIALIECDPAEHQDRSSLSVSKAVRGALNDTWEWRVSKPQVLLIENGKVQAVFDGAEGVGVARTTWGGG